LISNAIDELELHVSAEAPAIRGEALAKVIADYQVSQKSLQRLTQRYPASLLDGLLSLKLLN
jgi:DNA gyrase subunit B